ncbi:MAG: efflux RND transporter permease subunit [Candidatus Riflebacteria bacterium]|nr:efflux RND transporter permease subunit [Candidatus Riflebacteria bacterium]
MWLSDLCIERPVFALMIVSLMVVLGAFSYAALGVDLLPRVDFPTIVVTVDYPGASPEEVESGVTKVIEGTINTIPGIEELKSISFEGVSQIVATFKLTQKSEACAQAVREKVGLVVNQLPRAASPPVISAVDPDSAPIITIVVAAPYPVKELTEFVRTKVLTTIESIDGVGQVSMFGDQIREIHIDLDADRLVAFGITSDEVRTAIQQENVEMPGGIVETGPRNLVIRTSARLETIQGFANIVVRSSGDSVVRVNDLATVKDTQRPPSTLARLDGRNAIALSVRKQSGVSTVDVIATIKDRLDKLKARIPEGVELKTVRDQSTFILGSFEAVREHLILGAILASLVVLLFLRDVRTTIMVALSIPTSVTAAFFLMYLMGYTLNNMTLLALALAVGLVIDDAIVVHENAYRHMEELGKDRRKATSDATREIGLAVLATTFSLVVIFVPIALMPGLVGRFLASFGLTLAFAILASLLVSFTMTPMLCSQFLKVSGHKPGGAGGPRSTPELSWLDRILGGAYIWLLEHSMKRRWIVVLVALATIGSTGPLIMAVGKDLNPSDDQSQCIVNITCPQGTSLAETGRILTEVEREIRSIPEVRTLLTTVGEAAGGAVNEGLIHVEMVAPEKRKRSQAAVMQQIRDHLGRKLAQYSPTVSEVPIIIGGARQTDLSIGLQGPDITKLQAYAERLVAGMKSIEGLVDVESSLNFGKPEVHVKIDRTRAASYGISAMTIAATVGGLVGGSEQEVTKFYDETRGEEYSVRVRLADKFRNDPDILSRIPIRTMGRMVTLGDVATLDRANGPTQIDRQDRQRQVTLSANLHGLSLSEAQTRVRALIKSLALDTGYSCDFLGVGKAMEEQYRGFLAIFLLSAIFVYMILAAQFESLLLPMSILLSLPLCIPFGILSLILVHENMNMYSTLGLFMLFGIVKKNSILQVDYTNTLRAAGKERLAAILEANRTRLRPILMTTLTLIAGMLPMALGTGPGAAGRKGMALVVVGGQALCLLITLLVTPVAYSILDDLSESRLFKALKRLFD